MKIIAEYVWIDGTGQTLRSKSRTLLNSFKNIDDLPMWNFDGSSTGQAEGENSEVLLLPVSYYLDPFRKNENILVLCECRDSDMKPLESNKRYECNKVMRKYKDQEPWFGLEQEFFIYDKDISNPMPVGWNDNIQVQGPYYCGVGHSDSQGRMIMDELYSSLLYAGITISGINAEVAPSQWEFQIGIAKGIEAGDMLWMARYILHRICEKYNVVANLDPKPIPGDWNGSGCHCNFSTLAMRSHGGYEKILNAIGKLSLNHRKHINNYGDGNEKRLTGLHETSSIDVFTCGVANRKASIRIPNQTEQDNRGYLEDRRPASNCDPYVVTRLMVETILG